MRILVTGSRGYIGKALVHQLLSVDDNIVIGVDNDARARWVERCGGNWNSNDIEDKRFVDISADMADRDIVNELLAIHKPDVIIHLASQPSMPYSQISGERAYFTQLNNVSMCLNLLWGIKENGLNPRIIITTTTGIPGQGYATIPEEITKNLAGSWYHISRGFDSANCSLASKQWGQKIIELRTSIVYGATTEVMRKNRQQTRFDVDNFFGTVLNRFVSQARNNRPLLVSGQGLQEKPFISLEDTVKSIVNATSYDYKGHLIVNQTTEQISIIDLAKLIQKKTNCQIKHIENPRKEKEAFKMKLENKLFLDTLEDEPRLMITELPLMLSDLLNRDKRKSKV